MVSILIVVFICQHVLGHLILNEIKGTSLDCRENKELKFVKKTSYFWVIKNVADMSLIRTKESNCRTKGRSLCLTNGRSLCQGQVILDKLRAGHF